MQNKLHKLQKQRMAMHKSMAKHAEVLNLSDVESSMYSSSSTGQALGESD